MFYVYVYLDPRRPGRYHYSTKRADFTFDHEPIYVGKGVGDRKTDHLGNARKGVRGSRFMHKLQRILAAGMEPVILVLGYFEREANAFDGERKLIAAIGRADHNEGPLCNHTDGGDGVSRISEVTRRRFSRGKNRFWATPEGKDRAAEHARFMQERFADPTERQKQSERKRAFCETQAGKLSIQRQAEQQRQFWSSPEGISTKRDNQFKCRIARLKKQGLDPVKLLAIRDRLDRSPPAKVSGLVRELTERYGLPDQCLSNLYRRVTYTDLPAMVEFHQQTRA